VNLFENEINYCYINSKDCRSYSDGKCIAWQPCEYKECGGRCVMTCPDKECENHPINDKGDNHYGL